MDGERLNAARLVRLLAGWATDVGPLYRQLSDSLRELIRLGELPVGARLPSERSLAPALLVSRTTVVSAYRTLRNEGLLGSRQGSGTWVRRSGIEEEDGSADPGAVLPGTDRLPSFLRGSVSTIDFSSAAMRGLPLVIDEAGSVGAEDLAPYVNGHGYMPQGLPSLRRAIAQWLASVGMHTSEEQILVTSGAQQALQLLTAAYVEPGSRVVLEDPTFRGALAAFTSAGARVCAVPSDEHGVLAEELLAAITREETRLVYLLPTAHNPTGSVLSEKRRRRIARLAEESATVVVDDEAVADTVFAGTVPPPIAAYGSGEHVITVGSLSKVFWGGLRVGWVHAAPPVIRRLARAKGLADFGTSIPSQIAATRLLARIDEARALRREQLRQGLRELTSALAEWLPSWSWQEPQGGGSLWVRLPHGNATTFAQVAMRHGVTIAPGPVFSADRHFQDHLRLPYVDSPRVITAAVGRLSRAWEDYVRIEDDMTPSRLLI